MKKVNDFTGKYPFKAMDSDFIKAMSADVTAALADVEAKYGVKLNCSCDMEADISESVTLQLQAEFNYDGCDRQKEHFGFLCHKENLDLQYGIDVNAYNKVVCCAGKQLRIVDISKKQYPVNCVTIAIDGNLYQFHPSVVRFALKGDASKSMEQNILKTIQEQAKLFVQKGDPSSDLSKAVFTSEKWCETIKNYHFWGISMELTADDYGKTVLLYGKTYTIVGFVFNLNDKRKKCGGYRVVLRNGEDLFTAPVKNVAYALKYAASSEKQEVEA